MTAISFRTQENGSFLNVRGSLVNLADRQSVQTAGMTGTRDRWVAMGDPHGMSRGSLDRISMQESRNRTIVFVVGVARSGTTAVARLLNAHPSACIGLERYKRVFRRERAFPLELFEKGRFFSFEPKDTNVRPSKGLFKQLYETMAEKWDTATVVGDKEGYDVMDFVMSDVPDVRIIFMLRNVEAVASSWNVRAFDARDGWPSNNDYRIAVNRWNEANSLAYLCSQSLGDRFLVLDYEKILAGSPPYSKVLHGLLGLKRELKFARRYNAFCREYQERVATKQPLVLNGQADFIAREANMETYRKLSDLAMARLESA
jgi:hypothetical protein